MSRHDCPKKGKGLHDFPKGFRVAIATEAPTTPEKGKGLHDFRKKALGLQNNPRPFCHHRAVRCFRACVKELIEKPFYQPFHTCPYLFIISRVRV